MSVLPGPSAEPRRPVGEGARRAVPPATRRPPVLSTDPAGLPPWAAELVTRARSCGEDAAAALRLAAEAGPDLPLPGSGSTALRWRVLAAVARVNLTAARALEAHTDALAILAEAGEAAPRGTSFGVFAAEAPGARLEATLRPDGTAVLDGVKPWCSLAGLLDAALVTAHTGAGRALFRVDLRGPGVHPEPAQGWVARGLRAVTSGPVRFAGAPARPVGGPGWYLTRPGFAWGGIGVAACWHGGATGIAATLHRVTRQRADAGRGGELAVMHLGAVDAALHGSAAVLAAAAGAIDAATVDDPELLSLRARAVVADAAERVLHQAGHALGPAALAFDADHAARVADLELYVCQHHGERDLAALGTRLLDRTAPR